MRHPPGARGAQESVLRSRLRLQLGRPLAVIQTATTNAARPSLPNLQRSYQKAIGTKKQ